MQALINQLKELRLSGIASTLQERLTYAQSNKISYQEFLELLCEDEFHNRRDNRYRRRYKAAKLPSIKQLEDFDFNFQPSIDQKVINDLATCQFVKAKKNVVLMGDSGTGKSHLAIAFALKALEKEYDVFFTTVSDMLYDLHVARADNSYHKKLQKLTRCHLLILDELGFKQLPRYSVDDFFNVISKRYEQGSIIITTNKNLENWNDIFEDKMLTKAIVDRVVHHAVKLSINGKSYRTKINYEEAKMS